MRLKKIGFLILLFLSLSSKIMAEELQLSASISQENMTHSDQLIYTITVRGDSINNVPSPTLPDLTNLFQVLSNAKSTSISIINGKASSSVTIQYILQPLAIGTLTIKPSKLIYKNKTYETQSFSIEVKKGGPSHKPQTQQIQNVNPFQNPFLDEPESPKQTDNSKPIFLRSLSDKKIVYVGQPIQYTAYIYLQVQPWQFALTPPEIKEFWIEDLPFPTEPKKETINGVTYYVFERIHKKLIPMSAGQYTIPAIKASYILNPFNNGEQTVFSEPCTIQVKPLPSLNKPANFSGLVGDYTISIQTGQLKTAAQSPISITITVEGTGYLKTLKNLSFSADNRLKIFQSQIKDIPQENQSQSKRIFEYMIIPQISGKLTIPEFSITFFSPSKNQYLTQKTNPINITISKAKETPINQQVSAPFFKQEPLTNIKEDICYIKETGLIHSSQYLFKSKWFMLLLLINLGLLLYLIFNYILEKVEKLNPLKTKKQKAYQIAAHKLKKLHHKKEKDRSIQLYNILLEFLSNKTNHSFESKTMPQINELLKQKNLDSDLIEKTISMMEKLSYINYAPSTKDKADSDKIYQDVLDCIKLLNKNL